ncbi:uncharacterized protein K452DRAFT_327154 [Aplosporella prunicola CBS 121167]|uniref:Cytochrome P450 n=1 Tax=Aplosporella prunicola CBS 121167 TaxID=1176127 RepID=A0A6A6BF43_9PEZI|nr:uncharacterized protein K452DRAFT_327154 [Aplosporella prunicola CBS 121167]KAF2141517.1 hypothetical protein K452DRAFT_327154 [Aplosporella prunicola CBS 121167]
MFPKWALYFAAYALYNAYLHPLRAYPGPKLLAACALPRILNRLKGTDFAYVHSLHERYGDVVRVGPNELSFISSKAWKDIYGHATPGSPVLVKDPNAYGKPPAYRAGLFSAPDASHAHQRRVFAPAFSERALVQQTPLLQAYAAQLIQILTSSSFPSNTPVNLIQAYNHATFDIMADLAFSARLDLLRGDPAHRPWVAGIFDALKLGGIVSTLRFYFPGLVALLKLLLSRRMKQRRADHDRFAAELVDRRLCRGEGGEGGEGREGREGGEARGKRRDIWSLAIASSSDGSAMNLEQMHANAATFMIAGTETTATLLAGVTFFLLGHGSAMARLVQEVRGAFAATDEMSLQRLAQLRYLNACLEEALRLYPPVPQGMPRRTPSAGCVVAGESVPGDVTIFLTHWAAYRSARNFALPNDFIPERWLTGPDADARFAHDDKSVLQPFSVGPRNCLGKSLAYHEMRLLLANMVWSFDIELCEESRNWAHQKQWFLWEKPALMVRLRPVVRT